MGNLQDEHNEDRYAANEDHVEEQIEETKPEEPQGITLQEYYESKGIDISKTNVKKSIKKG